MHVVADLDRCDGNGLCAAVAPELFTVADDDLVRFAPDQLAPADESAAEDAVRACPKLALTLVEDR